jgi:hypothetical protein
MKNLKKFDDFLFEEEKIGDSELQKHLKSQKDFEEKISGIQASLKKAIDSKANPKEINKMKLSLRIVQLQKELESANYKMKSFESVNEGKISGGRFPEFQMTSITAGIRQSDIYINQEGQGKMTIKIGAYSGGSDGFKVSTPAKLEELTKAIFAGFRTKDAEVLTKAEDAEIERYDMKQKMQSEFFDFVAKELEAVDKKIEAGVMSILKKY